MASPISAVSAYAAMQRVGAGGLSSDIARPDAGAGQAGFAGMLQQFVGNASDSARQAEAAMTQATAGKGDLVDVVTAVAESEAALETLVSVRDRVISAYEEIMRMPM